MYTCVHIIWPKVLLIYIMDILTSQSCFHFDISEIKYSDEETKVAVTRVLFSTKSFRQKSSTFEVAYSFAILLISTFAWRYKHASYETNNFARFTSLQGKHEHFEMFWFILPSVVNKQGKLFNCRLDSGSLSRKRRENRLRLWVTCAQERHSELFCHIPLPLRIG